MNNEVNAKGFIETLQMEIDDIMENRGWRHPFVNAADLRAWLNAYPIFRKFYPALIEWACTKYGLSNDGGAFYGEGMSYLNIEHIFMPFC